jgi:chemotaxis protein methyltransferase WspC
MDGWNGGADAGDPTRSMSTILPLVERWAARAGLDLAILGEATVRQVLRQRMEASGCSEEEYHTLLAGMDSAEGGHLIRALLVRETWFFREPSAFDTLQRAAQEWRQGTGSRPLRVLCLGCATGEEPWSVAIALQQAGLQADDFCIDALDLDPSAISLARQAVYGIRAFRGGDRPAWLWSHFDRLDAGRLRLKPELRNRVHFRVGNLAARDWCVGASVYHAVFCRNVLIYLRPDVRAQIVDGCRSALIPGGLLFLGHADGGIAGGCGFVRHPAVGAFAWIKREGGTASGSPSRRAGRTAQGNRPGGEDPRRQRGVPKTSSPGANRERGMDPEGADPREGVSKRPVEPVAEADTAIDRIRRLADRGRYDAAERLCRGYLHGHPFEAEAHALLGVILAASNRDEEAIRYFRQALYLEPRQEASRAYLTALVTRKADVSVRE